MSHPEIDNRLPFTVQLMHLSDEMGVPAAVPIVQASFSIGAPGLRLCEKQLPVSFSGVRNGDAETSSYRYEPQFAFIKPSTDIVLVGHAWGARQTESLVRLCVGRMEKTVRVTGERQWYKSLASISMTAAEPFEKIPLIYERAFGGWDRSNPDPEKHTFEPRNPVGTGFRSPNGRFEDGVKLPNLEDPRDPVREYRQGVAPAGFGFISPDWQPRAKFAGTYDDRWMKSRMPLLPEDFDRRFFNSGSAGLIAPGYLRGDERVSIEGASPRGTLAFALPGALPIECRIQLTGARDHFVKVNLDTVIIDTDDDLVILIWRGYLPLRNGPHDVVTMEIRAEGGSLPLPG